MVCYRILTIVPYAMQWNLAVCPSRMQQFEILHFKHDPRQC